MTGLRIAYLTLEAPRQGQASYTHVSEIVEGLRRRGLAAELFLPRYTNEAATPTVLRRMREYIWLQFQIFRNWQRYDFFYVRAHYMAFPLAVAARLLGKPIVHEVNGPFLDITVTYPWTRSIYGLLNWLQRSQYRAATGLIAVTPQLQDWLRHEGFRGAIEVVPNGANLSLFNPQRARRADLPERYVVFFGGFARWQGIPVMLEAVERPEWPADVSLVIVGSGQMQEQVQQAAAKCGNVVYLGRLPYPEVGGVVAGALAGLVPKTREDDTEKTGLFPIKLFEILAAGVPAIVTDYPGQANLVRTGECGLIIAPGNPKALADAVAEVAADPVARGAMGDRGHKLIASQHSWECRSHQTAQFIERIVLSARATVS